MASSSDRKSGSSGRSAPRKRVVIGAEETVRVRFAKDKPEVEAERRKSSAAAARSAARQHQPGRQKTTPARMPGSMRAKDASAKASVAGKRIAATKRDERDQRRRSIRRRRTLSLTLLALLVAGMVWGVSAIVHSPMFAVTTVKVTGNSRVSDTAVIALAKVPASATMFTLNSSAVSHRVARNPWVASVKVVKEFPHAVIISVTERVPAAIVDGGGANLYLVSGDGFWLGSRAAEDTATMTVIRDIETLDVKPGARTRSKELLNALSVLKGLSPELSAQVKTVSAASVDKTALFTEKDVEIFIGSSDDLAKKDRIVRKILAEQRGKVVYINVRVVDRPTWRGLDAVQ